jgi:hypothetical protein
LWRAETLSPNEPAALRGRKARGAANSVGAPRRLGEDGRACVHVPAELQIVAKGCVMALSPRRLPVTLTVVVAAASAGTAAAQDAAPPQASATAPSELVPTGAPAVSALGVRVDCLHNFNLDKGAAQECFKVTGLRLTVQQTLSPQVTARLRLDPFASPDASRANSPIARKADAPGATPAEVVDDYALVWSPRPNLDVAVESYDGAAKVPSVSGLALANGYADTGWRQTALTVTYNLSTFTDMRVKFAAGNGEGETFRNLDPQQFAGFEVDATVIKGVRAQLGASLDGNNVGSETWKSTLAEYAESDCYASGAGEPAKLGYSMQRIAAGVMLDGQLPGAEGLRVGLGWQRNVASDLDKKRAFGPSEEDLAKTNDDGTLKCKTLDVDQVFVEDAGSANSVQRTTFGFNAQYRLLERYFVGVDYTSRRVDTGSVKLFKLENGDEFNNLTQSAYTFGGGMDLTPGLVLTVEYAKADLDRKYTQVYYPDRSGKTSDAIEYFNARLAYNWQ